MRPAAAAQQVNSGPGAKGAECGSCAGVEERRQESRVSVSREVRVTVLRPEPLTLTGRLINLSSRGAGLIVQRELPVEAAVEVDFEDALLLGEVRWCRPEAATFVVGLSVDHWLPGLMRLEQMKAGRQGSWV
ncbi:MAG: PilZ domain-containing protein [Bryobacterales bacterium]|nr:PilZ domain-containing protein [Bryobacterales bacterium]